MELNKRNDSIVVFALDSGASVAWNNKQNERVRLICKNARHIYMRGGVVCAPLPLLRCVVQNIDQIWASALLVRVIVILCKVSSITAMRSLEILNFYIKRARAARIYCMCVATLLINFY